MNNIYSWVLTVAILGIGMLTGLATIRDQVVQQFGDAALALENLDQSFSYTVGTKSGSFADGPPVLDPLNSEPACIELEVTPSNSE